MINLDFKTRISARKALEHPFFSENPAPCEPAELLPEEIRNPAPGTDYHEFTTKSEKNKKKDFKKQYSFKHNKIDEPI